MEVHPTPTPDARLRTRAAQREGLFTCDDARAAGLSASALATRVRRGAVTRRASGLYEVAGQPPSRRRDLLAALLQIGGEAALARRTAAEIHGLPVASDAPRIHMLVRVRSYHGGRSIALHRTRWWDDGHVTEVDGLRVTTVPRTLVDLAGTLSLFQLRKALTHAVRHGLTDAATIRAHLEAAGRVRGAVNLRAILDDLSPLEARTASVTESLFLDLTSRAGIPPTDVNHPVIDAEGRRRYIDAVYLPEHVPVELDSETWHGLRPDAIADRAREAAIRATGRWRPFLRFDWTDLTDRPRHVISEVRAALEAARQPTP